MRGRSIADGAGVRGAQIGRAQSRTRFRRDHHALGVAPVFALRARRLLEHRTPRFRMSTPTCEAIALAEATMPYRARIGGCWAHTGAANRDDRSSTNRVRKQSRRFRLHEFISTLSAWVSIRQKDARRLFVSSLPLSCPSKKKAGLPVLQGEVGISFPNAAGWRVRAYKRPVSGA